MSAGVRLRGWWWWLPLLLAACHGLPPEEEAEGLCPQRRDSLRHLQERHYTWGANLELCEDSIDLACLPVMGDFRRIYRGDRVVVAEFATHRADPVDSVWVKVAHSQEVQGWVRECVLKGAFVPTDSVSQFIRFFSRAQGVCLAAAVAWLACTGTIRICRRKQRGRTDEGEVYTWLAGLLTAFCATAYETMQVWAPDVWERFYFNPSLSPFGEPPVLAAFLAGVWLTAVVWLAAADVWFRRLTPGRAAARLAGLGAWCMVCLRFFILATRVYVGYALLAAFAAVILRRVWVELRTPRYQCGQCGRLMRNKGVCPHCGAVNS